MEPRGNRLTCMLRSIDGCNGVFNVHPGTAPRSVKTPVDPARWDSAPEKEVQQASFSLFGDLGMTGRVITLNQYQWRALKAVKLDEPFYAAILWGENHMKVVEDAEMLAKRKGL